jgi:spermidine synthase
MVTVLPMGFSWALHFCQLVTGEGLARGGLGAGAFACNTLAGETWRFFEIDPLVVKIARDPSMFTYLSSCQPDAPIVVGDARLTVASEPAGSFDFLLVDAFSSDSIPVHLLTREAVAMYLSRLSPDGVLVMHVSNRYLDLAPVLEAAIADMPGVHGVFIEDTNKYNGMDAIKSKVVAISRSNEALQGIGGFARIEQFGDSTLEPWTDDYSNIAGALFRHLLARGPQP